MLINVGEVVTVGVEGAGVTTVAVAVGFSDVSELFAFLSSTRLLVVFRRFGSRKVEGASLISKITMPPSRFEFIEFEPESEANLARRFKEPEGVEVEEPRDPRRDKPCLEPYPEL